MRSASLRTTRSNSGRGFQRGGTAVPPLCATRGYGGKRAKRRQRRIKRPASEEMARLAAHQGWESCCRDGAFGLLPRPLGVGFQRCGPRPPAFVSLGVQGEVETPWCFSSGVWGGFFSRKECAPRPCGGNRPLREQETMRKRTAMPCAFSLAEIMTAARRNSKLFVKGNDRFDLMKANFVT